MLHQRLIAVASFVFVSEFNTTVYSKQNVKKSKFRYCGVGGPRQINKRMMSSDHQESSASQYAGSSDGRWVIADLRLPPSPAIVLCYGPHAMGGGGRPSHRLTKLTRIKRRLSHTACCFNCPPSRAHRGFMTDLVYCLLHALPVNRN